MEHCAKKSQKKNSECSKAFAPFYCLIKKSKEYRDSVIRGIYGKDLGNQIINVSSGVKDFITKMFSMRG